MQSAEDLVIHVLQAWAGAVKTEHREQQNNGHKEEKTKSKGQKEEQHV